MANGDITNIAEVPVDLIGFLGNIGRWLQAIGILVIVWLIFQVVSFILNRKRMREIYNIKKDMIRIEKKIDTLVQRKK